MRDWNALYTQGVWWTHWFRGRANICVCNLQVECNVVVKCAYSHNAIMNVNQNLCGALIGKQKQLKQTHVHGVIIMIMITCKTLKKSGIGTKLREFKKAKIEEVCVPFNICSAALFWVLSSAPGYRLNILLNLQMYFYLRPQAKQSASLERAAIQNEIHCNCGNSTGETEKGLSRTDMPADLRFLLPRLMFKFFCLFVFFVSSLNILSHAKYHC